MDVQELLVATQAHLARSHQRAQSVVLPYGLVAVVLIAFWLFNSIYTINEGEVGVELQFGKPKPELSQPGLHFHQIAHQNGVGKLRSADQCRHTGALGPAGSAGQAGLVHPAQHRAPADFARGMDAVIV